ncbi:MAG TPA: baseplate J/gp47 family protein [Chloroflexota bacterium]|nr:baseplate J/gp47 family protein [Chloroflexota bacterium]
MFFRRAKIAPRSQELVFLDADDDLGTIRSKLEASSAEEIFLVIPRRSSVLRTPLEFRILARIANEMSSETVLVTEDPSRRRLANQEGFHTRRGLRTLKHLMIGPDQRPPRFVMPDWVPLPNILGFLSFLGLLIVAAGAVLVVYPQMRVTLVPQTRSISHAVDITVDPDIKTADVATASLPGSLLTLPIDVSASMPIPSDRTIGRDKAHGEIVVTSQRPQPYTLPKGTVVRVDGGARFVTDQDIALQPRVLARVGVTAVDAGTGGNVGPGQITTFDGSGFDLLDVVNQRPTTGGTDRQAKVVTEDDRKTLDDVLKKAARDKGFMQLQQRAGSEQTLPEMSLSVDAKDEKFDQEVGAESDQLTGRLTGSVSGTVFQNLAYNDLVGKVLERSAGPDLQLGAPVKVDVPGVLKIDGHKVVLRCDASGLVQSAVDADGIKRALTGTSAQDARSYLAQLSGLAEAPRVEMTPVWAPRAFRIDVNVQGPK